ncbi:hypothetical protein K7432_011267 [Basidiobolus ranarum]|uniref:GH16 domain-containing protein n=1 Tax=Basidiobolus ranarum TaxID=34480 RepID=A0ABR2WMH3_9FUNG
MGFFQAHRSIKLWTIVIIVIGLICLVVITPIVRHEKNKNHHRDDYNADVKALSTSAEPSPQRKSETISSESISSEPTSTSTSTTTFTSTATPTATPISPWIDSDTPKEFTTKSIGGQNFTLVFSDEFEKAGRTFAEGDDPKWTAVDLWYWATGDLEWYSPKAVSTSDGSMKIRMTKEEINGHSYMSGMVQSWNKFCFTGGIIEVNVSLPGSSEIPGFWPGIWTMGNLGRAGYGATTDGTWPYSYDTCDAAVAVNQSMPMNHNIGNQCSLQPGQRLNKCVCPGEDHPNPGVGRGAPEIDILEASVDPSTKLGTASMSDQLAPFNFNPANNQRNVDQQYVEIYNKEETHLGWTGGPLQQCVSGVASIPPDAYEGRGFQTYSFEYVPGAEGYIIWRINDVDIWKMDAKAIGPDPLSKTAQRLVSEEPMSIIMNFGMSASWVWGFESDLEKLPFPSTMSIDYVRVYQLPDKINVSCDPPNFPTAQYIKDHPKAYNSPTVRTWKEAGYEFPKYSLEPTCFAKDVTN